MKRIALIIAAAAAIGGCRFVEVVKPDGTRYRVGAVLTKPEIEEFEAAGVKLRGYKSDNAEIVEAAIRAGIGAVRP